MLSDWGQTDTIQWVMLCPIGRDIVRHGHWREMKQPKQQKPVISNIKPWVSHQVHTGLSLVPWVSNSSFQLVCHWDSVLLVVCTNTVLRAVNDCHHLPLSMWLCAHPRSRGRGRRGFLRSSWEGGNCSKVVLQLFPPHPAWVGLVAFAAGNTVRMTTDCTYRLVVGLSVSLMQEY